MEGEVCESGFLFAAAHRERGNREVVKCRVFSWWVCYTCGLSLFMRNSVL